MDQSAWNLALSRTGGGLARQGGLEFEVVLQVDQVEQAFHDVSSVFGNCIGDDREHGCSNEGHEGRSWHAR